MRKTFYLLLLTILAFQMSAFSQGSGMSGTYTINADAGQSPHFTSFAAAVQALSASGVSGQVVFEVANGTYEEFLTIPSIAGASANQRIIFRGMGTTNEQVVLTSNAGYLEKNTLTLDGADFISFEKMTLQTTSTNYANVVYLDKGVVSDYFINVRFVGYDNPNGGSGYVKNQNIIYDKSRDVNNLDSDLQFKNCSFTYGDYAFYMQGPGWQKPNDTHLLIENCTFSNQRFKSVYLTYQEDAIVRNNTFENNKDVKEYWAIDAFRSYYGTVVENNVIHADLNTVNAEGIIFRPGTGSAERPIIVRNNMISIHSNDNYSMGIYVKDDETSHLYVSHNTVKMTGTGIATNLFVEKSFQNLTVNNNIFINETPGYVFRYQSDDVTGRVCDYNRISFTGEKVGRLGTTDYATLEAWQIGTGFDTHTALCTPSFVSPTDLHLNIADGLTLANPLSYVTTDIDGEVRTNTPCAGADEYGGVVNQPPVVANPVQDITFENFPSGTTVNLNNTFDDPDDPNENIVIEVLSNSNSTLVSAIINGKTLAVQRLAATSGDALVTLKATSNGQCVETSFTVHCLVEDMPPVVANPIGNIVFNNYPASQTIDLSETFDDPDDPNENIIIEVKTNSNAALVSTSLSGRILTVERLLSTGGTATITLKATSDGQSVETSFNIQCIAQDLPPVVVNQLAPIVFVTFPQQLSFDLGNTFDDPDSPNEDMQLTVQSCPEAVTANIQNRLLNVVRTTLEAFNQSLVIRATSNEKYVDMTVPVSGEDVAVVNETADFEDVLLSEEGVWIPAETGSNTMISHSWNFTNFYESYFWGGFTTSNHSDTTVTGLDAQYTAVTGCGFDNSSQYAVAYALGSPTEVSPVDGKPCVVTGCYVTNNLWAYQSVVEGDGMATPFGGASGNDPDYFLLGAIGKNADGQTIDTAFFYLADYRFSDNSQDYVVNTWEWFDLSVLGEVASISFYLESTKVNSWGMVTPAYFCMDNFYGADPQGDQPPYVQHPVEDIHFTGFPEIKQVDLDGVVTDDDNDDDQIAYTILSYTNTPNMSVSIIDKLLTIERQSPNGSEGVITIRAISNGLHVDFDVKVFLHPVEGVDENHDKFIIYPNPTTDFLTVCHASKYTVYQIVDSNGKLVQEGVLDTEVIDVQNLIPGQYVIRLVDKTRLTMHFHFIKL